MLVDAVRVRKIKALSQLRCPAPVDGCGGSAKKSNDKHHALCGNYSRAPTGLREGINVFWSGQSALVNSILANRAASEAAAASSSAAAAAETFATGMQRGFIGSADALVEIVAPQPRRFGSGVGADFRPRDAVRAAQQRHCCTLDATSSVLYAAADGTSTLSCYDIASPLRASPGGGAVPRPTCVEIKLPSAPTALDIHPALDVVAMAAVDIDGWAQCVVVGAR